MRRLVRILKGIGIVLVLLLALGAVYARVGAARDARLRPPASEMFAVDGRRVHLVCTGGEQNRPVVLLDAGLGAWSVAWWRIQARLESKHRVCSFDRAGLGWSDPIATGYDAVSAAGQLRGLVTAAAIPTPFVYVGHSLGANFAQVYAARHPADVAALVLMEPGRPEDLLEDFEGTREEAMRASDCALACRLGEIAAHLGVTRLAARAAGRNGFDDLHRPHYRAGLARPATIRASLASLNALPKTAYQVMDVDHFGDLPLLVLASESPREPEGDETPADVARWLVAYRAYLATLAAESSRGWGPVVIPGSTHVTLVSRDGPAAAVANEIDALVASLATIPAGVTTP